MTAPRTPVVSVVGRSGSGKTTLIEKLVPALKARGLRVGTIKHDAHRFEIDREGKDSWRHRQAGAEAVLISSREKIALVRDVEGEWTLSELVDRYLSHLDIVVTGKWGGPVWFENRAK